MAPVAQGRDVLGSGASDIAPTVFCSGADLTALGTERGNRVAPDGDAPMGVSRLRLSKPVIAALSGYAVAGGLELALSSSKAGAGAARFAAGAGRHGTSE